MLIPKRAAAIAICTLAVALMACADDGEVTNPRLTPSFAAGGQNPADPSSLDLIEADYSGGLLDKDNANKYRSYAVLAPEKLPNKYKTNAIGKDATYSMVQLAKEFDSLSPAAKSEIMELQANGFGAMSNTVTTQHFVLHFATQGNHAVPAADNNGNGISDFIDAAAISWEEIWNTEINQLGYPAPKGTPAQKFHVYYRELPYYGYCAPTNVELLATSPVPYGTAAAYIVIENDFRGFPPNDEDVTGLETIRSGALKVTQAHEFMHASQFNINVYGSGWLMESHATWAEDAVYDDLNDWRWYINRFLATPDFPLFSRYLYGAAFFQHWLSETRGVDVTRQIWFAHKTQTAANAIRNVAFGGSWEGMKDFGGVEYTLGISDFTSDGPSVIPTPRNFIRATHTSYPVNVTVDPSTNKAANRAPWGLGSNFVEFAATQTGTITISFNGTDGFAWRAYIVATPKAGGPNTIYPITLDGGSAGSIAIANLGNRWSKVTLVPTIADTPGSEVPYSY
ncbi:MAG TPA: MXAN_6640 family putative metalloprotease, partial [Longimicrobiales bacterium]